VRSYVHRGTRERPGLVLGLDSGGSCVGLAFRVPTELRDEAVAYLRERELVTSVYLERMLPVQLDGAGTVAAMTFVVDRRHEQYAGALDAAHAAEVVRGASGVSGANIEYVLNTVEHLSALGIHDHWMADVAARIAQA
jgi:cation transport protein ChaC